MSCFFLLSSRYIVIHALISMLRYQKKLLLSETVHNPQPRSAASVGVMLSAILRKSSPLASLRAIEKISIEEKVRR